MGLEEGGGGGGGGGRGDGVRVKSGLVRCGAGNPLGRVQARVALAAFRVSGGRSVC